MFRPKISIVIPVYNGSNYLREAIDSTISQTCSDYETIVVNDGSNDDGKTESICRSYGDSIRYFYKENGGVASALNMGIDHMRGEWFAWLSHDDCFSPNRVESNLRTIQAYPDACVVFCRHRFFNADNKNLGESIFNLTKIENLGELLSVNPIHFCAITIRRSCFDEVGYFNEANRTAQDKEMQIRLVKQFPFYLDNLTVTLTRNHVERGTLTLTSQHKMDKESLCEYLYKNFSLEDFIPNSHLQIENEPLLVEISTWMMLAKVVDHWGVKSINRKYLYKALRAKIKLIGLEIINCVRILVKLDFLVINLFAMSIIKLYRKVGTRDG